jgi:hypothetical protein
VADCMAEDIFNIHVCQKKGIKRVGRGKPTMGSRAEFRGGPGLQASHQTRRGPPTRKKKKSFTFNLHGGGKKSEGNQGKDNGDRRMKKSCGE